MHLVLYSFMQGEEVSMKKHRKPYISHPSKKDTAPGKSDVFLYFHSLHYIFVISHNQYD